MADDIDFADLLGPALSAVPGYEAVKNRKELGQLAGAVGDLTKSPIQAHVEKEQAKRAAGQLLAQHAAANLGLDPQSGLPAAGRAPIAAPPTVQVPEAPAAPPAEAAAPPPPMPPPAAPMGAKAAMAGPPGGGPAGPYAQSPSMLPGTDPDEIAAAKRAADKQAADAKFAAEEKEVADAVAEGNRQKGAANSFLPGFLSALVDPSGKMHAQQLEAAGNPLRELMQKREALGKLRTERAAGEEQDRARSLNDPDSELTKTSATALRSLGVPVPKGYTASMFEQMKGVAQLSGQQKHEAAQLIVQQGQAAETGRHNRSEEGIQRMNAQAALAAAGAKAAAGKPLDEKELTMLAAAKDLPAQLQHVKDLQKDVGLSAISRFLPHGYQVGKQRELDEAIEATAPGLIPAIAPNARGVTPELIKEATNRLQPRVFDTQGEFTKKTDELENLARQRANTHLNALAAEGVNPAALAQLRPAPQVQEGAAPAGGGWDATKEARLQELRRKAASK
jgi:hypothetical protein